jgi:hypothetical protein
MMAIMGPHFIIVFDKEPNGALVIYHIRRPSFPASQLPAASIIA